MIYLEVDGTDLRSNLEVILDVEEALAKHGYKITDEQIKPVNLNFDDRAGNYAYFVHADETRQP